MDSNRWIQDRSTKLDFFCPLCGNEQKTNTIKGFHWRNHIQVLLGTLTFSIIAWPIFGFKGLVSYLFFWAAFEFVHRMRKRDALVCRSCGFDPFLYKRDVKQARDAVRNFWLERIKKDGMYRGVRLRNYETLPEAMDKELEEMLDNMEERENAAEDALDLQPQSLPQENRADI